MDAIEQNKNTVTEFIDALFTKGDLGAVEDYLAGECRNWLPRRSPGRVQGAHARRYARDVWIGWLAAGVYRVDVVGRLWSALTAPGGWGGRGWRRRPARR
jgi:hypothetical protein